MGKHRAQRLIEIDGVFHRMRRGKLVPIPPQWVGGMTTPKTIRQRPSKLSRKVRMALGHGRNPRRLAPRHCRQLREAYDAERRLFDDEQRARCRDRLAAYEVLPCDPRELARMFARRRQAFAEWHRARQFRCVPLGAVMVELRPPVRGGEFMLAVIEASEVEESVAYAGLYDSEEEERSAAEAHREEERRNWEDWQYPWDDMPGEW